MNDSTKTSRRQLFSLGTLIMLVPTLRFFVSASIGIAGRAAWLTAAASALPALLYMYFISDFVDHRRQGESMPEVILRCLGPRLGRAALLVCALWFLLYSGFVLRSGAERLIVTIYPNSSPGVFSFILGLVCLIAVLGNPRSIVRAAMLIKPVILGALLIIFVFSLGSISSDNLLPITIDDTLPVLTGSLAAVNILVMAVYSICFIEGLCPPSPGRTRQGCLWLLFLIGIMSLINLSILGMFGAELSSRMTLPFFIMVRNLVFFRTLERMEALVVMLWLFPDFLQVSLFMYAGQYCLRLLFKFEPVYGGEKLLDISRGRWLIWLGAAAVITCSLLIGPDNLGLTFWSAQLIPGLNLLFAFIFLPSIYIVGKLRKQL